MVKNSICKGTPQLLFVGFLAFLLAAVVAPSYAWAAVPSGSQVASLEKIVNVDFPSVAPSIEAMSDQNDAILFTSEDAQEIELNQTYYGSISGNTAKQFTLRISENTGVILYVTQKGNGNVSVSLTDNATGESGNLMWLDSDWANNIFGLKAGTYTFTVSNFDSASVDMSIELEGFYFYGLEIEPNNGFHDGVYHASAATVLDEGIDNYKTGYSRNSDYDCYLIAPSTEDNYTVYYNIAGVLPDDATITVSLYEVKEDGTFSGEPMISREVPRSELTGYFTADLQAKQYCLMVYIDSDDQNACVYVVAYEQTKPTQMHRLYNRFSGEHFYTADTAEKDNLVAVGWDYEGTGWNAPKEGYPVYRMYNRFGGEHHYTLDEAEKNNLVNAGWTDEGVGWLSDAGETVPVYREYNPYAFSNNHNYTPSLEEHNYLVSVGWKDEGEAWYGV